MKIYSQLGLDQFVYFLLHHKTSSSIEWWEQLKNWSPKEKRVWLTICFSPSFSPQQESIAQTIHAFCLFVWFAKLKSQQERRGVNVRGISFSIFDCQLSKRRRVDHSHASTYKITAISKAFNAKWVLLMQWNSDDKATLRESIVKLGIQATI